MNTRRWLVLLGSALLALVACSEGDLVIELDLQSFLTESGSLADPSAGYATLVLPVPIDVFGVEVLPPSSVGLVEAIDDLSTIRAVRVQYALQTVNRRGSGDVLVRLRLAGTSADLLGNAAVFDSFTVELTPATDRTVARVVDLPENFVDLFGGSELWLSADADVRVEAATTVGDSLAGHLWLRGLRARVVADREFF